MDKKEKLTLDQLERNESWKEAVIVFTQDSFQAEYSELERSYKFSRENKYFSPHMIGNSIFGDCLDGKDDDVRLDVYIADGIWKVEYCYILK